MKKLTILLVTATILMLSTSCDEYLDVNKNVDAPSEREMAPHLYLSGVLAAYQGLYYDIRGLGPLTQMMGTSGLYYRDFANHSYPIANDAVGEMWRVVYFLQGMNLENMINQAIADEAWTLAGIGYAVKSFSWDYLTKLHVDLPLEDAFVAGLLSHRYDYQEDIYLQVVEWAKTAISYLEMNDEFGYGSNLSKADIIYGGDKSKWLKFAHSVIVRNLVSLSNKNNFTTEYAPTILEHIGQAMQTVDDDATIKTLGGGVDAPFSFYNCFWGTGRANLSNTYWQHEYAVQVMTGTVPLYNEGTGARVSSEPDPITGLVNEYRPWRLNPKQIVTDTLVDVTGHFDPRVTVKLASTDQQYYKNTENIDSIKAIKYYGANFTSVTDPRGTITPNYFGRQAISNAAIDGIGRWLYRNNAPYILMTAAEMKFCLAETYWKMGETGLAYGAWKEGVALDMSFTAKYIYTGKSGEVVGGSLPGGDKIAAAVFNSLAQEYLNGPYVNQLPLSEFSLSHIMMQKWVALYPWGAGEAWVDMRKYHYDIDYTGDYPSYDNGWNTTTIFQKWDSNPNKVYKGLYLKPVRIEGRGDPASYDPNTNQGSPCYRIRPRYNSEYMWNIPSLEQIKPISGMEDNYHTSIPWFAYPAGYPFSK